MKLDPASHELVMSASYEAWVHHMNLGVHHMKLGCDPASHELGSASYEAWV